MGCKDWYVGDKGNYRKERRKNDTPRISETETGKQENTNEKKGKFGTKGVWRDTDSFHCGKKFSESGVSNFNRNWDEKEGLG